MIVYIMISERNSWDLYDVQSVLYVFIEFLIFACFCCFPHSQIISAW